MKIELKTLRNGFDGKYCLVHARAGTDSRGTAVMTAQMLLLTGTDAFSPLLSAVSHDGGESWTEFQKQESFTSEVRDGVTEVICDFTPKYHAKSGKILGTGHTAQYIGDGLRPNRRLSLPYSSYDAERDCWGSAKKLFFPDERLFYSAGAGCSQRHDLEDGRIILPIYSRIGSKTVVCALLCEYDGEELTYIEHGNILSAENEARGLGEPSVTRFGDKYIMTIRADSAGYVSESLDGLHYSEPRLWRWQDGEQLPTYNTQQHLISNRHGLWLVYTRRGLGNDHVFRHRAPLLISRVDPDSLRVIREEEVAVIPERGARLGNFGATWVSDDEAWVTVGEWMQPVGCEKYGSDNSIYLAKLRW